MLKNRQIFALYSSVFFVSDDTIKIIFKKKTKKQNSELICCNRRPLSDKSLNIQNQIFFLLFTLGLSLFFPSKILRSQI